ncbi:MAG: hypothetical protein M1817_001653 [Caeruleum heppii]|nr:MAG: hypothetical protein M1817_001653 [Caeruleum heppii]
MLAKSGGAAVLRVAIEAPKRLIEARTLFSGRLRRDLHFSTRPRSFVVARYPSTAVTSRHLALRNLTTTGEATIPTTDEKKPKGARKTRAPKVEGEKSTKPKKTKKKATGKPKKKTAKKPAKKPAKKAKPVLSEKAKELREKKKEVAKQKALKQSALQTPKKLPQTAWTVFAAEQIKAPLQKPIGEVVRDLSVRYRNFSAGDLEHYNHVANQNRATNDAALKAFIHSFTPQEIAAANRARLTLKRRSVGKRASPLRDDRKQKKPLTGFLYFFVERQRSGDFKHISIAEASKLASKEWKALTDAERAAWRNRVEDRNTT